MAESVLCEDGVRVVIGGSGDRALLYVKDGSAGRFWCDTQELEMVLIGVPIEIEAFDGSCRVEVGETTGVVEFSTKNNPVHTCHFEKRKLAEAIAEVRNSKTDFS